MDTSRKERRRGKPQLDMAMMLAMMDRYGPEAQRRQRQEDQLFQLQRDRLDQEGEQGKARTKLYENEANMGQQELGLRKKQFEFLQQDRPVQQASQSAQLAALLGQNQRAADMFPIQQGMAGQQLEQGKIQTENAAALQPFVAPQASAQLSEMLLRLQALEQQNQQTATARTFQAPMLGQNLQSAVLGNASNAFDLEQRKNEAGVRNQYMPGLAENAFNRDEAATTLAQQKVPFDLNQAALANVNAGADAAYRQALAEAAERNSKMTLLQSALAVGQDSPNMMKHINPQVLHEMSNGLFNVPPAPPSIAEWRETFLNNAQRAPMEAFNMVQNAPPGYREALQLGDADMISLANNVTPEELLIRQGIVPKQPGLWQKAMNWLNTRGGTQQ